MIATAAPLRFAGYAAMFGIADAASDIIQPGAFARTLRSRRAPFPLFWQHNPDQTIGVVEHIKEDKRGLQVIARIDNDAGRPATLLRRGEVSGLSFGYRARSHRMQDGNRLLGEIELFEVSLVTHPLQFGARVHMIT